MLKPRYVFARDTEWTALCEFVSTPGPQARLGLVYGKRRQGKTLLLEALCEATGGFAWQARQQSSAQNLRDLEDAIIRFRGSSPRLESWDDAIGVLLELRSTIETTGVTDFGTSSTMHPCPVVLDEIGYVLDADPGFGSRLQAALSPATNRKRTSAVRLILCGSAFGQMRSLVDAHAPLRGRTQLDLIIHPFRFRETAEYWGLQDNPDLAFRLHSFVGGTPAYLDFVSGSTPKHGDLDSWVVQRLLSSSSPMFREGRVTVAEDPSLSDRSLYWSILGAVADGAQSRGEITRALGRPPTSLHKAIGVLVDAGWLMIETDPLRSRSSHFVVNDPIVRFHRLVIEPAEARLIRPGKGSEVWNEAAPIVQSQIFGPHFERLAREWMLLDASEITTGGRVTTVGPSSVGTGEKRLQLDLVAFAESTRGKSHVCAVGEAKSGHSPTGPAELDRLDLAVSMLPIEKVGPPVKRILVSRSGFTRELQKQARLRADVELVDLNRLYFGE
jgi:uncharacterized protein